MASIAPSEHYDKFIRKQLQTGRYASASDVVRAGLGVLEDFASCGDRLVFSFLE